MTQPDTLHTRLKFRIDVLLEIARAATPGPWECATVRGVTSVGAPGILPSVAADVHFDIDAHYLVAFNPAVTIAWLEGELEVLERHAIVWRDIGWMDEERETSYDEIPVCGRCVPKHSHFRSRAEVPEGPCDEILSLAHRLGVSVDG